MKNLLILSMLTIFLFACKDEGAAGPMGETEYTLEELENDTNWIEVTDYELLEIPCLKVHELEEKYYFKNDEDYQELSNYFYDNSSCTFSSLPEVDFDKEEVIGFSNIGAVFYQGNNIEKGDSLGIRLFYNYKYNKVVLKYKIILGDFGRHSATVVNFFWLKSFKNDSLQMNDDGLFINEME
jgi:hypothetical protein